MKKILVFCLSLLFTNIVNAQYYETYDSKGYVYRVDESNLYEVDQLNAGTKAGDQTTNALIFLMTTLKMNGEIISNDKYVYYCKKAKYSRAEFYKQLSPALTETTMHIYDMGEMICKDRGIN